MLDYGHPPRSFGLHPSMFIRGCPLSNSRRRLFPASSLSHLAVWTASPSPSRHAHFQLHQPLGSKADHLAQKIRVGALFHQPTQGHDLVGHPQFLGQGWCQQPVLTEESWMTTQRQRAGRCAARSLRRHGGARRERLRYILRATPPLGTRSAASDTGRPRPPPRHHQHQPRAPQPLQTTCVRAHPGSDAAPQDEAESPFRQSSITDRPEAEPWESHAADDSVISTPRLRRRQTKGAETDMLGLTPPRHIPTLPGKAVPEIRLSYARAWLPKIFMTTTAGIRRNCRWLRIPATKNSTAPEAHFRGYLHWRLLHNAGDVSRFPERL